MTETEWMGDLQDPSLMISHFEIKRAGPWSKPMKRKLRLLACGCCRLIWQKLEDPRHRNVVEVAECYADGHTSFKELKAAGHGMYERSSEELAQAGYSEEAKKKQAPAQMAFAVTFDAKGAAELCMTNVKFIARASATPAGVAVPRRDASWEGYATIRRLVRCIFGNPFRPITIDPRWLTATVVDLAQAIYDERAFDRLPILGDALMDSGCDSDEIIAHCRGEGVHVRGCWLLDLILGKE